MLLVKNNNLACFPLRRYNDRVLRSNIDLGFNFINRHSLSHKPLINSLFKTANSNNIFYSSDPHRELNIRSIGNASFFYNTNTKYKVNVRKNNISKSVIINDTMFNIFSIRNEDRYLHDYENDKTISLISEVDILCLSLVKSGSLGNGYNIKKHVREHPPVGTWKPAPTITYDVSFAPEDLVILVSKNKLDTKFLREHYSIRFKSHILETIERFKLDFYDKFSIEPTIKFVDDSEIYKYIKFTHKRDSVSSLVEIMNMDKVAKDLICDQQKLEMV